MFNLDQTIEAWRRQMAAAGIKNPGRLDELESHLRDDFHTFTSAGKAEIDAFRLAVTRVGNPDSLAAEFKKANHALSLLLAIASFLWIGASLVLASILFNRWFEDRLGFLLFAHILTLTAGYGAAFLAGGFGIYHVVGRWFQTAPPVHDEGLNRVVFLFNRLAAGLVMTGLLSGMFWSARNRGSFMTGDPREIGTLFVVVWLIASWLIQRSGRVHDRVAALLAIGGNMLVGFAWFGAGSLAHGYPPQRYWPLDVLLASHLVFLALGIVSPPEAVEA